MDYLKPINRRFSFTIIVFALASWAYSANVDELVARIDFPSNNSLVRANVPVFGVAAGNGFSHYRLEFGVGEDPKEWKLIRESTTPEPDDPYAGGIVNWNKDWGVEEGNLGRWETGLSEYPYGQRWKDQLRGLYTLRLTVVDQAGRETSHAIRLIVATVIRNDTGGKVVSLDDMARLEVKPDSLAEAFVLAALLPSTDIAAPANLELIGSIYEFRPPSLRFFKPATLRVRVPDADIPLIDEGGRKAGIHVYDPVIEKWHPLPTRFNAKTGEAECAIEQRIQKFLAFYALFAVRGGPSVPVLADLPREVQRRMLRIAGTADPYSQAIVWNNGEEAAKAECNDDGEFSTSIALLPGMNEVAASSRDALGNESGKSEPRRAELNYRHPRGVKSIRIIGQWEAARGQRLAIELISIDSSGTSDATLVRVFTSSTDQNGIVLEASESRPDSGIFATEVLIAEHTAAPAGEISARKDGETITAAWAVDETRKAQVVYKDRVPPSIGSLTCDCSLIWQSFEGGPAHPWQTPLKATSACRDGSPDRSFLRIKNQSVLGNLAVTAWKNAYAAWQYPLVSFDYRGNPQACIDMLVAIAGKGTKAVGLTDDSPFFARFGSFNAAKSDDQWHHCEANLLSLLKERFPSDSDWKIDSIEFADWDGGDRIFGTKFFGQSAARGGCYDIDNFGIMRPSTDGKATFTWSAQDDSGIEGYSYVLDKEPLTIPPEEITGTETKKSYEGLPDGRWWFHVRAKDKCGNWGAPNHAMVIVDTKPPEVAIEQGPNVRAGFEAPVLGMVFDEGAGVDPSTIRLEADGRLIPPDAVTADPKTFALELHPDRMKPWPLWYVNDFPVELRLAALKDYAGRDVPEEKRWRLIADSPVTVPPELVKRNGWCKADPKVSLSPAGAGIAGGTPAPLDGAWHLAWMRTLAGDRLAEAGCYIREIGLFAGPASGGEAAAEIPIFDGGRVPRFVAEIKVDKSVPRTEAKVETIPAEGDGEAQTIVTLSHSEFAWRRGGLLGRYYRGKDFTDLMCERVDPFIYFFDDRGQFTPPVAGAHSATWEGAVYVSKAEEAELELAIWNRGQASGSLAIDGEVVLELLPKDMGSIGYKKLIFQFTEGMHEISLRYSEPKDVLTFALFRWRDGQGWKERIREPFGDAATLYYPQNVGTTFCRWNDEPEKVYSAPLAAPPGENVLTFWTVDQAGNEEQKQRRTIRNEE